MDQIAKYNVAGAVDHGRTKVVPWISWIVNRFSCFGPELLWVILGQLTAIAGALVGVRLLTKLLPPAAYGELALEMTLVTLVNHAAFGPLGNGATRFYAAAVEQEDVCGYLKAVRGLASCVVGFILFLYYS